MGYPIRGVEGGTPSGGWRGVGGVLLSVYLVPPSGGVEGVGYLTTSYLTIGTLSHHWYTLSLLGVSPEIIIRYGLLDIKQSINLTTGIGTLSHHGYTTTAQRREARLIQ